ncbi:DUF1002 domain-containing protein [Pontibacillus yanchengensis]|uniref:DUF1002 domain-containing protein n=1 Tax=Pontibacillus yanchengensis TaxID=462910 RepID=A0A6I4ZYC5_9BACI|nr:DUF1002 domain-containing protein [Pontibacillus yanchengensis]MYL33886.1 DUF1002 domain-containing protein [Pontibacillus yanchengensis]
MKRRIIATMLVLALMMMGLPQFVLADAAPGDEIVSLGADLSEEQKQSLLNEMDVSENVMTVTVTNKEEHEYLGDYISKAQIGTRAISSSKITIGEKGDGLTVETNHINWVTADMYKSALATAGVEDAHIYATAPFDVSGTAALTGLLKAYETSTGEAIAEDVKQAANQEMVTTAKLGEDLGKEEATQLVTAIKSELANNTPQNKEEMQNLIQTQAEKLNLNITDEQLNNLTDLFMNLKDINIDWNAVGDRMGEMKQKVDEFLNSEQGQNFLDRIGNFIKSVVSAIGDFFSGLLSSNN